MVQQTALIYLDNKTKKMNLMLVSQKSTRLQPWGKRAKSSKSKESKKSREPHRNSSKGRERPLDSKTLLEKKLKIAMNSKKSFPRFKLGRK